MGRGAAFSEAEDQIIRLGLQRKMRVVEIADWLGRSRQSIYLRINRMKKSGEIDQAVLDMGQGND